MDANAWIWMDGSRSEHPPGKLLSGNYRWYGEAANTGMTYRYLTPLSGIGDTPADSPYMTGKRLVDGRCDWVFKNTVCAEGELTVEFDFQQRCVFTEADVFAIIGYNRIAVMISADGKVFRTVCEAEASEEAQLTRVPLTTPEEGRFMRLTLTGTNITLYQVWIWGDTDKDIAEDITDAQYLDAVANSIAFQSIMGAPATSFSDVEAFHWSEHLKKSGYTGKAAFSQLAPYGSLTSAPILPEVEAINAPTAVRLCQDGTAVACFALTNTDSNHRLDIALSLDCPQALRGRLFAAACIPSRWYGMSVGPLLDNEDSALSKSLMHKYTANGPVICDFPLVHLPPAGSCIIWVKICAENAEPGTYTLTLHAGEECAVDIEAKVFPVALGNPYWGVLLWANSTIMYPLRRADRLEKEIAYRREIGVNIYWDWPEPGTDSGVALQMDPSSQFMIGYFEELMLRADQYTETDLLEEVRRLVDECVLIAEKYGLSYDRWFISMPDEPCTGNIQKYLNVVKRIKDYNTHIRVYSNPAFWVGFDQGAVEKDEKIADCLREDYGLVDISVPLFLNLENRPEAYRLFTASRDFNGQYAVSAQHMDADRPALLSLARAAAWESISRDMNWWGFFAYHRPSFECWDNRIAPESDKDGTINYQCVYAGMNGPVPTRASELVREGYDDYRMMQILKVTTPEVYEELCQAFLAGSRDFVRMRERMLDALEVSYSSLRG